MGQGIATHHQIFQYIVEITRVGQIIATNGFDQFQFFIAEDFRYQVFLLGLPPVQVSSYRVDFAIVGNVAEWLGQFPLGDRVGRKPGVDHGDR